jgi:hypothetical protein
LSEHFWVSHWWVHKTAKLDLIGHGKVIVTFISSSNMPSVF